MTGRGAGRAEVRARDNAQCAHDRAHCVHTMHTTDL